MKSARSLVLQLFWLAMVCLLGLGQAGCSKEGSLPGDRCNSTSDCKAPLVCSNRFAEADAEVMGICVYPDAVPDAAVPSEEDGSGPDPDAETVDASS